MSYVPPSKLDGERTVLSELRKIAEELTALGAERSNVRALRPGTITAQPGEITRAAAGQTVLLPGAKAAQGKCATVLVEGQPVTIQSSDRSTVNGAAALTVTTLGAVECRSTGTAWWTGASGGVAGAGAPVNAEYIVGAASAGLTNERVATDSAEVDVDLATPGVASWALRVASVAFAKLQDLAGLSILGRASNSAGVMATITATAGGQYARSNAAGTALEFGDPASTSVVNTSGQLQRAALTGDVTAPANSNATTIANDAVTNAKLANMSAGTQKGRQIDSGAAGDPVDLTGAEQGENIRFATSQVTSVTGTQNNFALNNDTTELVSGGASVTFTGFVRNSVAASGKPFILRVGSGTTVTLAHNTTSTANRQIACPGDVDLVLPSRSAVWLVESDDKWRVLSLPGRGRLLAFTEYTSGSGTHNYQPETQVVIAHLQGGGGGGGGSEGSLTAYRPASGGQAGEFAEATSAAPGASGAYSVGAAGTGGVGTTGSTANGTAGGNTTLVLAGSTRTALGGGGTSTRTSGGTVVEFAPRAGHVSGAGENGDFGLLMGTTGPGKTGKGGATRYGPGGTDLVFSASPGNSTQNGQAGVGLGSGGSGAFTTLTNGDANGGAGVVGYIGIWEYS